MPLPRILMLVNEPTLPADHPDAESEHDVNYTVDSVVRVLQQAGLTASRFGVTDDLPALISGLTAAAPDVVFNFYEGTAGWGAAEAYVSGVLELLRIPYTGSPTQPLILCRSKPLTKRLLVGAGLPTAPYFVVEDGPLPPCPIPWPVIVKPGSEDASLGIDQNSVVTNQRDLDDRVEYIRNRFGPSVLVEQFIRGREFHVALYERDGVPIVLPFSEILFQPPADAPDLWPIVTFDAKWLPASREFAATPAKNPAENVSPALHESLVTTAKKAFQLFSLRDYARLDYRVDEAGNPYILEVNPNPCISQLAGVAAGLESAKVPYGEFILGLARAALRRGGKHALADAIDSETPVAAPVPVTPSKPAKRSPYRVRPAKRTEREAIASLLTTADGWPAEDRRKIAQRLVESVGKRDPRSGRFLVVAGKGELVGIARIQPLDDQGVAVLDVFAVAPTHRRQGHGLALLRAIEDDMMRQGGRVLLAEVPSAPGFGSGRQFLFRQGFRTAGDVPEYYRDGHTRLTYSKLLPTPTPTPAETAPVAAASH